MGISLILIAIVAWALVTFLCVELLVAYRPNFLRKMQTDNCLRADGSLSERRQKVEQASLRELRQGLLTLFAIIAVTSLLLIILFHATVIPLPLAAEAIQAMDTDITVWKENLQFTEQAFDDWYSKGSGKDADAHKRLLWNAWPAFVLFAILWSCGVLVFAKRVYIRLLNELRKGIEDRSVAYEIHDYLNCPSSPEEQNSRLPRLPPKTVIGSE